jgi:hypothetical protein
MNNFNANYGKILEILKQVAEKSDFLSQIRLPRLGEGWNSNTLAH